jgi:hypothetical protein
VLPAPNWCAEGAAGSPVVAAAGGFPFKPKMAVAPKGPRDGTPRDGAGGAPGGHPARRVHHHVEGGPRLAASHAAWSPDEAPPAGVRLVEARDAFLPDPATDASPAAGRRRFWNATERAATGARPELFSKRGIPGAREVATPFSSTPKRHRQGRGPASGEPDGSEVLVASMRGAGVARVGSTRLGPGDLGGSSGPRPEVLPKSPIKGRAGWERPAPSTNRGASRPRAPRRSDRSVPPRRPRPRPLRVGWRRRSKCERATTHEDRPRNDPLSNNAKTASDVRRRPPRAPSSARHLPRAILAAGPRRLRRGAHVPGARDEASSYGNASCARASPGVFARTERMAGQLSDEAAFFGRRGP